MKHVDRAEPRDNRQRTKSGMQQHDEMMEASYGRFSAMLGTSGVVMFILMYSLVLESDHVRFADTRFFMAIYMTAAMAVVMLAFMLGMYRDRRKNTAIVAGAVIVFTLFLYLARSQRTIGDVAFMKAMIPHHSIAILTSSRAQIKDPRVRKLADEIISAQRREIVEMDSLILDLERR